MYRLVIIILLALSITAEAQDPYHVVYGLNDGLPSDELYDIHVAEDNLLWIATDRGVCTYDGYDFEVFSTKEGLAYPTNFKIIPDQYDRLWFNGYDGSLSFHLNDSFYKASNSEALKNLIRFNYYNNVGVDSLGGIYTHQLGVSYKNQDPIIYRLNTDGTVEEVSVGFDVIADSKEHNITLEKCGFQNTAFYRIRERNFYVDAVIQIDSDKHLFAMNGSKNRKYKGGKSVSELFLEEDGVISRIIELDEDIRRIYKDSDENILVATSKGLLIFRKGNLNQPPKKYFEHIDFTCINQDIGGNYWAGTKTGLLYMPTFDFKPIEIKNYNRGIVRKLGVLNQHLLIITEYAGAHYLKKNSKAVLPLGMNYFNNGDYAKIDNGLVLYNGRRMITEKNDEIKFFNENEVLGKESDVSTISDINPEAQYCRASFNHLKYVWGHFRARRGTASKINVISINDKNETWLGAMDRLNVYTNEEGDEYLSLSDSIELLNTRISDVKFNSRNQVWVSTVGNGLIKLVDYQVVDQINELNGLSSDLINRMFIENDTTLWICTNKGLDKVMLSSDSDQEIKYIIKYNNTDGLPSNFVYDFVLWNDQYWVATSKGLAQFERNGDFFLYNKPSLEISKVEVEGQNEAVENGDQLTYNQNYLTFHFRGISYRKPKDGFYQYRLIFDDEDAEWRSTDTRSVRFTNLEAGEYTFQLEARNKYNIWSDQLSFEFSINPHFSASWWFLALCLALTLGLIAFFYFWRLRKIMDRNRRERILAEATLKTEIAELTTFRNQFNPHFVFNALNSIQNYIFKKDVVQAGSYLSKFSKLIRESLNLTSEKYVTIRREFKFLESYLTLEQLRFPMKFTFSFINQDDIPLDLFVMPSLLMQPAVENVLKHAFNEEFTGKLSIEIEHHVNPKALMLSIIDNGKGIQVENRQEVNTERKSFGLKLIHERIELLKLEYPNVPSSFVIQNRSGADGTIAEFVIPKISKEANVENDHRR